MNLRIVAHTSFLGNCGYNSHSQNFFTHLNKLVPVRIRNYSYTSNLKDVPKEQLDMIIEQKWNDPPFKIGTPFFKKPDEQLVNIVLNESNHYFFYDNYDYPKIAYNVWESTRQLPDFFTKLLEYDQFWCPTKWQKDCTIEQGFPEKRVKVVPEGVNGNIFNVGFSKKEKEYLYKKYNIPMNTFTFMVFGRWDYRKSIKEIIESFNLTFSGIDNVMLLLSVDNPFPTDSFKSTEERLRAYKLENEKIKVLHFVPREDYIQFIKYGDVFLSCARSEGWNLPLIEAIACGTPSICSGWGAQLEFADGIAHTVNVPELKKPKHVYMVDNVENLGYWGEPDFNHLQKVMLNVYNNYANNKERAVKLSKFVRELYTWENAALLAYKYIDELVKSKYSVEIRKPHKLSGVKLNLGCGNVIKPGYINIDKYNNVKNVDLKCDIEDLPFKTESVEELYSSHVFEHISLNNIYAVLTEWRRVLQIGGRLVLRLPDLETEVTNWLKTPDEDKWLKVEKIFGSQSHPGNTHYCGFNCNSLKLFLESFDFKVESIGLGDRGFGNEIQCTAVKFPSRNVGKATYICHFVDGPFIDITGDSNDKAYYQVEFLDPDSESTVHSTVLRINHWTRPYRKFYTNWYVKVRRNGKLEFEHKFDLKNKNVLISFDSKSIGDTIAWMPYVEEFRKKHKCNIFLSTFWNILFKDTEYYKNIVFINPGTEVKNLYASYIVGCYDNDLNKNVFNWRTVPLQKVCSDILGLEYKEIKPIIGIKPKEREIKEKYVTISEWSTFQCKHWNYHNGWQEIVNYLNENGFKVAVVSKEKTDLKNIIDLTNRSIEETITNIYYSELFLGVSAGPAWISWCLNVPVIMISGYSSEWSEFKTNIRRIINKNVCNSCFNDVNNFFDRGDWNWCPRHKGTERQFECTKQITPEIIKKSIHEILF